MGSFLKLSLIIFLFAVISLACTGATRHKVCFRDVCITAEVSDSELEREQGLISRKHLPSRQGMLFVFKEEGRHNFWMKDMQFPLDIIWISKEKKIVDIMVNALPCVENCEILASPKKNQYVLEVNSGFVSKYNIRIGDKAIF
jgi:uncharacterized membrane protein (UPF0127 family)